METNSGIHLVKPQVTVLPGGKDKDGHPILLITVLQESQPQNIIESIQYLLSIFR